MACSRVYGYSNGREVISLKMIGLLDPKPQEDGIQLGDYTLIKGKPSVEVVVKREISQKGGLATAAMAVNMIPRVLSARPGLITMKDISLPSFWPAET